MSDERGEPGPEGSPGRVDTGPAGRPPPTCPTCKAPMELESGRQVHDLWSEKYVCTRCARETYRSYGRGSV